MDDARADATPTASDSAQSPPPVRPDRFDAVLFDMDGVITDTARLHAGCWKQIFDEFLAGRRPGAGEDLRPFDADEDYRRYVDGKARTDGVRDFLASRGIRLPPGREDSPPDEESVRGLARRKDALFGRALAEGGVEVYADTVRWVHRLREQEMATAVVSASHHCREVLESAGIAGLFDARVDGNEADRLGLAGKPAPDAFLEAARRLKVDPGRAVVVEDARSGVQAGRAGGFGLVVGVARHGDAEQLLRAGAHRVVSELTELAS